MRTLLLLALLAGACSSRQPSTPPPPAPAAHPSAPADARADAPATAPPDAPSAPPPTDAAVPPDAMRPVDAGVLDKTYGKTCKLGERHEHDKSRKVITCGGGLVCCYPCGVRGCDNTCMTEQECRAAALRP